MALRKFEKPLSVSECKTYLDRVLHPLCEAFPSRELYQLALDTRAETGWGFCDSLIAASALQGNGKVLYSGDFQSGRCLHGLTFRDSF